MQCNASLCDPLTLTHSNRSHQDKWHGIIVADHFNAQRSRNIQRINGKVAIKIITAFAQRIGSVVFNWMRIIAVACCIEFYL